MRVLEIGAGSGRNTIALEGAGITVLAPGQGPADAALSTHALLHGTLESIAERLDQIAAQLRPGAPLYGTFGSVRDARFGEGDRLGAFTFAPTDGDERGVAHTFFDEPRVRALIERRFVVESLVERGVDAVVGTWAHPQSPLESAVHWFAVAKKR